MSPEQRREMIVRAALPLVVEYGTSVTTAQIARAAGIGEGTIFRAFGDKDAVLAACMQEALRPDDTLAHVASISLDLPLAERLVEASEAMRGHLARMGAVTGALATSGRLRRGGLMRGMLPERPGGEGPSGAAEVPRPDGEPSAEALREGAAGQGRDFGREASMAATREVLVGLFEPERDTLRLPPEQLAEAFQFLALAAGRGPSSLTSAQMVDLFLHGALKDGEAG
ncbi:TetR/AcrR family transcriptional regulator [Nonomuraea sp. M3C6]|uniref:TetR/AcrR family transcriptional regulator n=1 Tax=Nonomuraea marmarensis TaxID=3351344 RepID=A0ABW7ABX7_9ACTN